MAILVGTKAQASARSSVPGCSNRAIRVPVRIASGSTQTVLRAAGLDTRRFWAYLGSPPPGSWWLLILEDSDQAAALGYHDLTSEGLPLGKVFAATDLKFGSNWTVTASHELLEMLADPNINLTVFIQSDSADGKLYAYEVCDACENDQFGYMIGNVLVSDFVYPAWFEDFRSANSTQFDQGQRITQPLQLLAGGYIGVFDVSSGSGWQQFTARKEDLRTEMRGNVGSRRERRRTLRDQWLKGRPHVEIAKKALEYRARVRKAASGAA